MGFLQISQAICMHLEVSFLLSVMLHFLSMREGTRSQFSACKHAALAGGGWSERAQGGAGAGITRLPREGPRAGGSAASVPPRWRPAAGLESGGLPGLQAGGAVGAPRGTGGVTWQMGPSGQWQHAGDGRRAWGVWGPLPGSHALSQWLRSAPAVASHSSCL